MYEEKGRGSQESSKAKTSQAKEEAGQEGHGTESTSNVRQK